MNLFVGHASALEYWRAHTLDATEERSSRSLALANCMTSLRDIAELGCSRYGMRSDPLHIVAADRSACHSSTHLVCHVMTGLMPARAFARVAHRLYVSSPELCVLQMACSMPLPLLVELADELCGFYRLNPTAPNGFTEARPVTTPAKLRAFASRIGQVRGAATMRAAMRYVVSRSASPRETTTTTLLCLPHALGGYGLELPHMNSKVPVREHTPFGVAAKELFCDLYWPAYKLAVEYDSDLHHTGERRISRDSKRRSSLGQEGIYVVTLTNAQLKSTFDFDEIASLLAKRMGKRLRIRMADFPERRLRLRTMLLSRRRG